MKNSITYKSLFAWLLLLTYFLNPLRVYQPYINYNVNYDYISTVLCINKAKPEMQCEGKCHLDKDLKEQAKEESGNQSNTVRNLVEEIPFEKIKSLSPDIYLLEEAAYITYSEKDYHSNLNHSNPPPKV